MEQKTISIGIKDIREVSFSMQILPKDFEVEKLSGNLNFYFALNEQENFLIVTPLISYAYKDGDKSEEIIRYTVRMTFEIPDLGKHITVNDDNSFNMPSELSYILLNLCLSSLRGMLVIRTQGQPQPFIFPVLNIPDLVKSLFPNSQIPFVAEGKQ